MVKADGKVYLTLNPKSYSRNKSRMRLTAKKTVISHQVQNMAKIVHLEFVTGGDSEVDTKGRTEIS